MTLPNVSPMMSPLLMVLGASFGVAWLFGPSYIHWLKRLSMGQFIREDGPQSHLTKAGTPTTGGVLIWAGLLTAVVVAYFVQPSWVSPESFAVIGVGLVLAFLGGWDDAQKVLKRQNKGVTGYTKLGIQALTGMALGLYMMSYGATQVALFNWGQWELGWFFPLYAMAVVMAASNAVNLTDGLDGLAGFTLLSALMMMGTLFLGYDDIAQAAVYPDLGWITVALVGGIIGFLVFNIHPARVFMGDVGSLSIGGMVGALALLGKIDFWLVPIGIIFVLEALSVIIQVVSFKTTGKRVFKMSPLHHHFELCGWKETQVVFVFTLVQVLFGVMAVFLYNN